MTYPAWPTILGRPLQDGYGYEPGDARRRVRTDNGPGSVSLKSLAVVDRATLSFMIDTEKLGILWAWYRDVIDHGTGLFRMPNWLVDGWAFLDENGTPVLDEADQPVLNTAIWLCRFGERLPGVTRVVGLQTVISFDVHVMP